MSTVSYLKRHLEVDEQVDLLVSRGMVVEDPEAAREWLRRIGYYRLSAYWYPRRRWVENDSRRGDEFEAGTSFDDVIALYEFDERLRRVVHGAIEKFEVQLRSTVGHTLGRRSPFAHVKPECLAPNFVSPPIRGGRQPVTHANWLAKLERDLAGSKEEFAKHYASKYDTPFPVWISTEVMTFGSLSYLVAGLADADLDTVAESLGLVQDDGLALRRFTPSLVKNLVILRNKCAHSARLWNAKFPNMLSSGIERSSDLRHLTNLPGGLNSLYPLLAVLAHVEMKSTSSVSMRLSVIEAVNSVPDPHSLSESGFPVDWEAQAVWM